jgi:hypothetical protein
MDDKESKKRNNAVLTIEAEGASGLSAEDSVDPSVKKNKVGRPKGSLNKTTELKLLTSCAGPSYTSTCTPSESQKLTWPTGVNADSSNIIDITSALSILNEDEFRLLTMDELFGVEQIRLWGPLYDLVVIYYLLLI